MGACEKGSGDGWVGELRTPGPSLALCPLTSLDSRALGLSPPPTPSRSLGGAPKAKGALGLPRLKPECNSRVLSPLLSLDQQQRL